MTRSQRIVIAVLLLVLIIAAIWAIGSFTDQLGTDESEPTPTVQIAGNDGGVVGLFLEPDDGRAPILEELDAARQSIDLEVYLLGDEEIISALERAHRRGVAVRVILEEHPFGGAGNQPDIFARLEDAGIAVRWGNPAFRFSHIKTFVIDKRTAIIMNLNLTRSSFTNNREFGVVTTRPADVAQAAAIFEADWQRSGEPAAGPLVVSPTNSREVILDLIDGAEESIDVYAEVLRDAEVVGALMEAEERGVDVRLIMSNDSGEDDDEERAELVDAGIDVRIARGLYIHAKMVLVDGVRAYVGSQNFTATSLDQNRELGIVLDDRANIARLAATFDQDFAAGRTETR